MFEKLIPVIIALIALQFIVRVMQKKKNNEPRSEWRDIDYKKRIDAIMKGRNPDTVSSERKGITFIGINDFNEIPDDMRDVRRDINRIREAVSIGLRAKIGRPIAESRYSEPEKMFDEFMDVIRKHQIKTEE